jgi:hypothetical protein
MAEAERTASDLVLVSGISVEQRLDLEPVDPSAEGTSESSVPPKVELRETFSNDMNEGFDYQFFYHQNPSCDDATLGYEPSVRLRGRGSKQNGAPGEIRTPDLQLRSVNEG